ncbi:hypothetical protein AXK12_01945 [Cephaloticoccus capnophilus]|uniref:ABC-type transport auxiliary lipoprotein component domain-containing protein n=1 Tax=Cephaloticoccus capnophilus TaxID=1548208 RepID=A0A139SS07_9BACT|nr:LPS assembly lipoprotein LptE [Cephaloticoccus capnophilus]KXU37385.1 hypothetical protein AXK12_01945 [Cephaloticoccus capnophilus]
MPRSSSSRLFPLTLLSAVFAFGGLFLTGCGYQLGTPQSAPLAFSTLYVAPVKMRALIPQADAVLTGAVRERFSRDGRVTLAATPTAAGAVLEITIRNYRRDTATADPDDTGLARKFTVVLIAEMTLREGAEPGTGKPYFSARPIEIRRDIFADGGQQQAEYQILPLLAQDLADKAIHAVLDTW